MREISTRVLGAGCWAAGLLRFVSVIIHLFAWGACWGDSAARPLVVLTPSSAFGARSTWSLDTLVTSRCHFLVRMPWQAFCKPAKPPPILRVGEEVAAHALSGASFVSEKDIAHDHLMGLHASLVNAIMLPSGFIFANLCRPLCIVALLMKLAGGLLCSQWWHTDASPLPVPIPVALSPPCGQSWS